MYNIIVHSVPGEDENLCAQGTNDFIQMSLYLHNVQFLQIVGQTKHNLYH